MKEDMYTKWIRKIKAIAMCIDKFGGRIFKFNIKPKAEEEEIKEVEEQLGFRIEENFRNILKNFSKGIEVCWSFPDSIILPEELKAISSGRLYFDLEQLWDINYHKNDLIECCFSDLPMPSEEEIVKHNLDRRFINLVLDTEKFIKALAFSEVGNGDYIVIDIEDNGSIRYLSHELDKTHGAKIADNFVEYIDKITAIAMAGSEDWQLEVFMEDYEEGINPYSNNGDMLRKLLDLDIEKVEWDYELDDKEIILKEYEQFDLHMESLKIQWERKYEITIKNLTSGETTKTVIPAINGGWIKEEEYREAVEKSGEFQVIDFKEFLREN